MGADRVARGRNEPTKYWLSTLSAAIGFHRLVDMAKLRWRIERDYQELKQESGSATSRGVAGAASITTPRCALRPTGS
jgi:SRSO17 transposase